MYTMLNKAKHLISQTIEFLFGRLWLAKKQSAESGLADKKASYFHLYVTSRFLWPNLRREDGEAMLRDQPDGTFLVWQKEEGTNVTLELLYKREGHIMNMKIQHNEEGFSLDHNNTSLPKNKSLDALILTLISKCRSYSLVVADETRQKFGLMKLKFPLTRNVTLMDHCKRKIRSSFPDIDYRALVIPRELTDFLMDKK